ncbi:MAG: hypothetical protein FWF76_00830 [Oscillospiraceae bacterium]|nr:hypothetical protein [Oscillospiraceae bacterium]
MKKIIITVLIISALLLVACTPSATNTHSGIPTSNGEYSESEKSVSNPIENVDINENLGVTMLGNDNNGIQLSNEFISENGVFALIKPFDFDTQGYVLSVRNELWDEPQILCARLECLHNSIECLAFFDITGGGRRLFSESAVYVKDDRLYVFVDNTLFELSLNGGERRTVTALPENYERINSIYHYNNNLFFMAMYSAFSEDATQFISFQDFVAINYSSGTERVIYSRASWYDENAALMWYSGDIIGIYDGYAYYLIQEGLKNISPPVTQLAYDTMRNNLEVHLYRISLATGQTQDVLNGVRYDSDSIALIDSRIFWHSRRDKQIISLDLTTNQRTVIVDDIEGYFTNFILLDERLIFYSNNHSNQVAAVSVDIDKMFYVDLYSGEVGEFSEIFTMIRNWGENFLFVVFTTNTGRNSEKQWATISRTDFWNDDFSNIQIMS